MALTTTADYATTIQRHIGSATEPVIKSFYAAAATSYTRGQFVTIDSNGRVANNATDDAAIDGVVNVDCDNSTGAADDKMVSVIVKGPVWVNGIFSSAGAFNSAASIGAQGTVCGDSGTTAAEGQAVGFLYAGSNKLFTSLSIQAIPSSGPIVLKQMLCYFEGNGKWA